MLRVIMKPSQQSPGVVDINLTYYHFSVKFFQEAYENREIEEHRPEDIQ